MMMAKFKRIFCARLPSNTSILLPLDSVGRFRRKSMGPEWIVPWEIEMFQRWTFKLRASENTVQRHTEIRTLSCALGKWKLSSSIGQRLWLLPTNSYEREKAREHFWDEGRKDLSKKTSITPIRDFSPGSSSRRAARCPLLNEWVDKRSKCSSATQREEARVSTSLDSFDLTDTKPPCTSKGASFQTRVPRKTRWPDLNRCSSD